jgi:hypothetical protein
LLTRQRRGMTLPLGRDRRRVFAPLAIDDSVQPLAFRALAAEGVAQRRELGLRAGVCRSETGVRLVRTGVVDQRREFGNPPFERRGIALQPLVGGGQLPAAALAVAGGGLEEFTGGVLPCFASNLRSSFFSFSTRVVAALSPAKSFWWSTSFARAACFRARVSSSGRVFFDLIRAIICDRESGSRCLRGASLGIGDGILSVQIVIICST